MEINTQAKLCLIGDVLHDRGNNDYFTLLLLKTLKEKKLNLDIIYSNHDKEFLDLYTKNNYKTTYKIPKQTNYQNFLKKNTNRFIIRSFLFDYFQRKSIANLNILLNNKLISEKQIKNIIDVAYLPQLKLIDYAIDDNVMTIYSHAPVDLSAIKKLAVELDVAYNDSSSEELAITIESINLKFNEAKLDKNKLAKLLDSNAFEKIAFNRNIDSLNRCNVSLGDDTLIKFTHGHNGNTKNKNEDSFVTNLDDKNHLGHGQIEDDHLGDSEDKQYRVESMNNSFDCKRSITHKIQANNTYVKRINKVVNKKMVAAAIFGGALAGAGIAGLGGLNLPGVIAGAVAGGVVGAVIGLGYYFGFKKQKKSIEKKNANLTELSSSLQQGIGFFKKNNPDDEILAQYEKMEQAPLDVMTWFNDKKVFENSNEDKSTSSNNQNKVM